MPRSQGTSRKGKPKHADRVSGMGRALQKSSTKSYKPKSNGHSRHGAGMSSSGAPSLNVPDAPLEGGGTAGEGTVVNNKSVLEMDDLSDFLHRANLASKEFTVEREQFVVLDDVAEEYRPDVPRVHFVDDDDDDDNANGRKGQRPPSSGSQFEFCELSVPRRPPWNTDTTPEELNRLEQESFLEWRRGIAYKEEQLHLSSLHNGPSSLTAGGGGLGAASVTQFEKNINVWRQLWRVLERCDVTIQIVDARNPLFYYSSDLTKYSSEELGKPVLVLVNKADYLTVKQRFVWNDYFLRKGIEHLFFSAYDEQKVLDDLAQRGLSTFRSSNEEDDVIIGAKRKEHDPYGVHTPLTRCELQDTLRYYATIQHSIQPSTNKNTQYEGRIQYGMVGFPNVGKSSVINVLVGSSKHTHNATTRVAVASQPGKTKHFQTLLLPDASDIMLCDCPGLVFPSLVSGTADLIAAGVSPLNQMRDVRSVISLICKRIPRLVLEGTYGIQLPFSKELYGPGGTAAAAVTGDHSLLTTAQPTVDELLDTYCIARSLLAPSSGVPDHQRAARVMVKDYVEGKLLYCHAPPLPPSSPSTVPSSSSSSSARNMMGDVEYARETIYTSMSRTKRLTERLLAKSTGLVVLGATTNNNGGGGDGGEQLDASEEDGGGLGGGGELEDDLMLLDVLGEGGGAGNDNDSETKQQQQRKGNRHKSRQKHGKKGRKDRNKDPYGCHTDDAGASDVLSRSGGGGSNAGSGSIGIAGGMGVIVNAGKYGKGGYTRPNYSGAKGAVPFEAGKKGRTRQQQ